MTMRTNRRSLKDVICCIAIIATTGIATARERAPITATVLVQAGQPGCRVDLDGEAAGTSNAAGNLTIQNVEPGDHYAHVQCPGEPEADSLISPQPGVETRIVPEPAPLSSADDPVAMAEQKAQLLKCIQQAVQLRAEERLDEAAAALRQAMVLDPKNSDLHRELGITFLQAKEWKRARVEMLEALHHDPNDADAHNGLGYALEKLGDIDGAVKEYRTATNLEPDDSTFHTHYLEALVKIQARKEGKK